MSVIRTTRFYSRFRRNYATFLLKWGYFCKISFDKGLLGNVSSVENLLFLCICTTSLQVRIKKKRDSFWRQKWHRFPTLTDSHSAAVIKLQYFVKSLFLIKVSVFFQSYNSEFRTDSRLLCGERKLNN